MGHRIWFLLHTLAVRLTTCQTDHILLWRSILASDVNHEVTQYGLIFWAGLFICVFIDCCRVSKFRKSLRNPLPHRGRVSFWWGNRIIESVLEQKYKQQQSGDMTWIISSSTSSSRLLEYRPASFSFYLSYCKLFIYSVELQTGLKTQLSLSFLHIMMLILCHRIFPVVVNRILQMKNASKSSPLVKKKRGWLLGLGEEFPCYICHVSSCRAVSSVAGGGEGGGGGGGSQADF